MNYEIGNRLEEISALQDGWFDRAGCAPEAGALQRIAANLIAHYPERLALLAIVPTPEGNLLLEWQSPGDPSVDLRLEQSLAEYHAFDQEGRDVERDFPLGNEAEWKALG